VYIYYSSPTITNSIIQNGFGSGIVVSGPSDPVIGGAGAGNTISKNGSGAANGGWGINASETTSHPIISHNVFFDNKENAIHIGPELNIYNNTVTGTALQAIEIYGGHIDSDTTWAKNDMPYIATGSVAVYGNSTGTTTGVLNIEPGVEIRFDSGAYLSVVYSSYGATAYKGVLNAQGTDIELIKFTSNASTPAPGDWDGIRFMGSTQDAMTIIEHCIVEYAGNGVSGSVYVYYSSPIIQYNQIRYRHNV